MTKIDFNLRSDHIEPIQEMLVPGLLNIPVRGMSLKTARGKKLEKGAVVAQHPGQGSADVHASLAGKVTKVSFAYVTMLPGEGGGVAPVDLSSVDDDKEMIRTLRRLGVSATPLMESELLLINGLNPEPGVTSAEALLAHEKDILIEGLSLARRLVKPSRCILVTSGGPEVQGLGDCEVQTVRAEYPASIEPLLIKAITGKENAEGTAVLDIHALWELGMVATTGLPVTEVVVTVGENNWRIPVGTPLRHALAEGGLECAEGDVVRLGGVMRGEAAYSLDQGISKQCRAIGLVKAGEVAPVENVPCINCGECVLHCPARLMPNLITRYAEFDRFEDARKQGLDICFGCGICATVCMARRPLLHLIRFAKEQVRTTLDA
ncbi:4Fe-4S dicluster domain-containing protein [Desulfovibrio ferrophilus]|uniref:4Fe-4S ferredoxin iron-sulfur binding domain-containing protein n=1 Tax=Desulfovibrio ferrophilus TaxID=241368 RepID=A0A2Z6AVU6_9BACT|nr:electron transporter RnfC [Desulfovibrio ferrophilus]BBD07379.1 4Fe-4S ferredoxin iron-sulfur binding domain-containing protein [Desulfovibrio ferrophilus]